jgi:hypothetical protein
VLDKVINDGDPYWFVTIHKFKQTLDRKLVGSPWGNGTWRFTSQEAAEAKFNELSQIPEYKAEAETENKRRAASSLRLRARHAKGQVTKSFRLTQQDKNRPRISYSSKIRRSGNTMKQPDSPGFREYVKPSLDVPADRHLTQLQKLPLLTDC